MYGLQRTDVAGIKKPAVRKNSGLFDVNFSKSLSLFNIVSVPKSGEQLSVLFFITLVSTTNSHLGTRKVKLFQATFYSTKLPPSPILFSSEPPPGMIVSPVLPAAPPSGGVSG